MLRASVGAELEFYLQNGDQQVFIEFVDRCFADLGIIPPVIIPEKGQDQFEAQIHHREDVESLIYELLLFKEVAKQYGLSDSAIPMFEAKPFSDLPGSALHINLSLLDQFDSNVFAKRGEVESPILLNAIGGLCSLTRNYMCYFAPHHDSYLRYNSPGINTPTTVSWGGNNRTVAVRVPTSCSINRRVEYRVAGADSDPAMVIHAILRAVEYGIANNIQPPQKIYGIAGDAQYSLPRLPMSLEIAKEYHTPIFESF